VQSIFTPYFSTIFLNFVDNVIQTVEAVWQREQLRRQRKRTSLLSKARKSGEPGKVHKKYTAFYPFS
jgi:hypothetical protein